MRTTSFVIVTVVATATAAVLWATQGSPVSQRGNDSASKRNPLHNPVPDAMRQEMAERAKPSEDARLRARRLLDAGDVSGAEVECRKSLTLAPTVSGMPINPEAVALMGDICLRQRKNWEALKWFLSYARHAVGGTANLNVAIAYCRLGDYQNAKQFYSDAVIRKGWEDAGGLSPQDLPGTANVAGLEASALLNRGASLMAEVRRDEALADFLAAEHLVPGNPFIEYSISRVYLVKGDAGAALPHLRTAARAKTSRLRKLAQDDLKGVESWLKLHPQTRDSTGR
jgi:tetratricopeptide (TPR) repeat protein